MRNSAQLAVLCVMLAPAIVSCSGDGRLVLHLTDAPADIENMATAVVTIASVEAHVSGYGLDKDEKEALKADPDYEKGKHWVVVSATPRQFDLLALRNDVTAALGELSLPAGKVTQVRLHLDPTATNEITFLDGHVCAMDLSGVNPKGVKINHPFKAMDVKPGRTIEAVIDFDLKESLDMAAPCVYRLKPVIKLKSVKEDGVGTSP